MNAATLQLISMVLQGVLRIVPETAEDYALVQQWIAFCKTIVDENRDPTPDEEAKAHAFAQAQHNAIQGG